MDSVPHNNLEEHLAQFAANRKSRSVASVPQTNRKFTFRKISSLDKSHGDNRDTHAFNSAGNSVAKSKASSTSIHPSTTFGSSTSYSKPVSKLQVNGGRKVSDTTKQKQLSITTHFQSSQKQTPALKPCDSVFKSFITDDFDDPFDDLSDFDIPSTARGNSSLPTKKPDSLDNASINKSQIADNKKCAKLSAESANLPKCAFELKDSQFCDSSIAANPKSKLDNSTPIPGGFEDDDDDDIVCLNVRKKKPICIFSDDDENEENEQGSKNMQNTLHKQGQEPNFPTANESYTSSWFSTAATCLKNKVHSSENGAFSPKSNLFCDKPVNAAVSTASCRNNTSLTSLATTSPQNNEQRSINEYSNHPLLHKNYFQNATTNSLQAALISLKDLNFSVMTEICSFIEKDPSMLMQNKYLESLMQVRTKILSQCEAAELAMTTKSQSPIIKSATVSPFYSKPSNENQENSFGDGKGLRQLHSTPLFHTVASQLRINENKSALSANSTPGFNGTRNKPFTILTPIVRSSPDNPKVQSSPQGERSILNQSNYSSHEDQDLIPDDFYDDEIFNYEECDIPNTRCDIPECDTPNEETTGKVVAHDIYGKALDSVFSQIPKDVDAKAVCGKFYGNYRDDGASMQFKGHSFAHSEEMMSMFKNVFGLQKFRHNQLEAINAALLNEDCFILMPTGGGKSLCYQLPALLTPGVTIVISPLRSLIMDQVQKLWSLDIPANSLSGDVDASAANNIYLQLATRNPDIKLLYVTPEKISASNKLISAIQSLFARKMLARFVIDEAHCVSQWGHDFRPDYKRLKVLREKFPGVPMIALTATATPRVRVDILEQLGMSSPKWFLQSFNRPNLKYEVRPKKNKTLVHDIAELIKSKFRNMSGIIYCLSRNDCDNVASELCRNQIQAISYHAGLDNLNRNQVQEMWINDQFKVVCATIAFGMGIDKPDVRFVIHHTIPKSIEGYYQESGRAGRDGELSWCILYYSYQDMHRIKRMISGDDSNKLTLSTHFGNLFNMVHFCENTTDCRRVQVLQYFGEKFDKQLCSKYPRAECDNCFSKDVFEMCDVTEDAKAIVQCLSSIVNNQKNFTLTYFVDIFKGAKTQKILAANHSSLPLHGRGSNYRRSDAERLLRKLVLEQFLQENLVINRFTELPCSYVYLGKRANELLQNKVKVLFPMKKDSKNRNSLQVVTVQEDEEMNQLAERCYNELIKVSKTIAADRHMHYTNVVNVEALRQMSREMPSTEEEMLLIPHITRAVYDKYGQQFLEVTERYKAEKCVIESARMDAQMLSAFIDDDDDNWSNPSSPPAASNKFSSKTGYKRKKPTKSGPAKKKFYKPRATNSKWKQYKGKKSKMSQSSSNSSAKVKSTKGNFTPSVTGRVPGFLPVPKPQGKPFSRSFLPTPRVFSTS